MKDLSPLTTPGLLFAYLDVLPRHATFCAMNMSDVVRKSTIVTNRGKKQRTIYAPEPVLSYVQRRVRERLLSTVEPQPCAHGFVAGRGTVTNAAPHVGKRLVINIDLKDFFPGISARRVNGMWRHVFACDQRSAALLTSLTTYDGHLCQGFSTSPDIANILCQRLDRRLSALAGVAGFAYTRYADDLTLSTDSDGGADSIIAVVKDIVGDEGFVVNDKKIAIMRSGRRQKVTGLVVNGDKPAVPRHIRRLLRSACHHWPQQTEERKQSILGWINYINAVNKDHADALRTVIAEAEANGDARMWSKNVSQGRFSDDIQGKKT